MKWTSDYHLSEKQRDVPADAIDRALERWRHDIERGLAKLVRGRTNAPKHRR